MESFVSFADITNISLPNMYGAKKDNDLDAQKYVLTCIKNGRLLSQTLEGCTVLHFGAAKGDLKVVKAILRKQIDVDLPTTEENELWAKDSTPLHCAVQVLISDATALVQLEEMFLFLLEKGADINALNAQGETPLHLLFSLSSLTVDFGEKILDKQPLLTLKSNVDQTTPLHRLLDNNPHLDPMPWFELYLAQQGDKNARFKNGDTFLHYLARRTDLTPAMIKAFHRIFDDSLARQVNKVGNTPETILSVYNYKKENLETYRRYFKYQHPKKKQKTEK